MNRLLSYRDLYNRLTLSVRIIGKISIVIFLIFGFQIHIFGQKSDTTLSHYLSIAGDQYLKDDYREALKSYELVFEKDSTLEIVSYRLGVCYAKLFIFNESTEYFVKSIKMNYRIGDALFNIGLNYSSQQKDSFALVYFELASKYLPDDDEIKNKIKEFKVLTNTE